MIIGFRVRVYDRDGKQVSAVPFQTWEEAIDFSIMARDGEYKVEMDFAPAPSVVDLATLTVPDAIALISFLTSATEAAIREAAED